MADENVEEGATEEAPVVEEQEIQGAEFVPEVASKAKPDIYSALLGLAFVAFLTGIILAGNELHDFYDVQFWLFSKK